LIAITLFFPFLMLIGYYAYHKLASDIVYCGSYGRIDGELGWTLTPESRSCYGMVNRLTGGYHFMSEIFTDGMGFRAERPGGMPPQGAILAIGDSWTFGFAVDYRESYPYHLSRLLDRPVVNMGIPGYGAAQTLLLLERHVEDLKPRAVVYLTYGLWTRSVCRGDTRPWAILKPCFWLNLESDQMELITPRPGFVHAQAARGIYPGGYLTAGQDSWSYYLVSRPIIKVQQLLIRAGLLAGKASDSDETSDIGGQVIAATLERLLLNSRRHQFTLVLVDPGAYYEAAIGALPESRRTNLIYVARKDWMREVDAPSADLPADRRRVPKDGHFTDEVNRFVAVAMARRLAP